MDKRVFLKVKLKSLAEEARIIKREEQRRKVPRPKRKCIDPNFKDRDAYMKGRIKESRDTRSNEDAARRAKRRAQPWYPLSAQKLHELNRHRLDVVRVEARLTNIAYAWIRGRDLSKVDSFRELTAEQLVRVVRIVQKYGDETRLLCIGTPVTSRFPQYATKHVLGLEYWQHGKESEKISVAVYPQQTIFTTAEMRRQQIEAADGHPMTRAVAAAG